jgi:hypothetical protein
MGMQQSAAGMTRQPAIWGHLKERDSSLATHELKQGDRVLTQQSLRTGEAALYSCSKAAVDRQPPAASVLVLNLAGKLAVLGYAGREMNNRAIATKKKTLLQMQLHTDW